MEWWEIHAQEIKAHKYLFFRPLYYQKNPKPMPENWLKIGEIRLKGISGWHVIHAVPEGIGPEELFNSFTGFATYFIPSGDKIAFENGYFVIKTPDQGPWVGEFGWRIKNLKRAANGKIKFITTAKITKPPNHVNHYVYYRTGPNKCVRAVLLDRNNEIEEILKKEAIVKSDFYWTVPVEVANALIVKYQIPTYQTCMECGELL